MGKLWMLFVGIFFGCGVMLAAFNYHIVKTEGSTLFVKKTESKLTDVYVDIRKWNASDWSTNPEFSQAMIKAGHGDLVKKSVASSILDRLFKSSKKK